MSEFQRIEFSGEYKERYWKGPQNAAVRYYTYASRGITLLNEFKYYAMFVLGGYWTARVSTVAGYHISPEWILIAGILGLPCLVLLGRWHLYRAQKPAELVNTYHGSITQFNSYNMQVKQIEQQEEIIDLLRALNEKSDGSRTNT